MLPINCLFPVLHPAVCFQTAQLCFLSFILECLFRQHSSWRYGMRPPSKVQSLYTFWCFVPSHLLTISIHPSVTTALSAALCSPLAPACLSYYSLKVVYLLRHGQAAHNPRAVDPYPGPYYIPTPSRSIYTSHILQLLPPVIVADAILRCTKNRPPPPPL